MRFTGGSSQGGAYTHQDSGRFNSIYSSHAASVHLLHTAVRGLEKSIQILKHFARGKIKLVNLC
jgi:hypothetical protein